MADAEAADALDDDAIAVGGEAVRCVDKDERTVPDEPFVEDPFNTVPGSVNDSLEVCEMSAVCATDDVTVPCVITGESTVFALSNSVPDRDSMLGSTTDFLGDEPMLCAVS